MKKLPFVPVLMIVISIVVISVVWVQAQSPPNPALKQFSDPKPEVLVPPAAAQQEVTEAFKAEQVALTVAQTAQARLEAAQAKTQTALYKAMASAGMKPEDCAAENNPFACVRQDPKGISFEKKKTEAAKK